MQHLLTKAILPLVLFLSLTGFIPAQESSYFPQIQYLTSDEGLSQSEVTCIIQDQKGFIWIGTRGGLNRYDGYSFKIFQNEIGNANSLINNSIESLFEDKNGYIWIGTKSNGVSRYNPRLDHFSHFQADPENPNAIKGKRIISIAESQTGEIWMGTWRNGLNIFDPEKGAFRHLLGQAKVSKIIQSQNGDMWVATLIGLFRFSSKGEQLGQYNPPNGVRQFVSLIEDKVTQKLYLGTWRHGMFEFDPSSGAPMRQFIHNSDQANSISSNNAYHLFQDSKNRIWIGTWGGGLNLFHQNTGTFTHYDLTRGGQQGSKELYLDALYTFEDSSGILWIGTNGGGVCKIDENIDQFGLLHKNQTSRGLPKEPVWSVLKDQDKVLWVSAKGNGSVYYSPDGVNFDQLPMPTPFPERMRGHKKGMKIIYQSRDQSLWFASKTNLFKVNKSNGKYEAKRIPVKDENNAIANRLITISALHQTSDGTFWIGTQQEGLRRSLTPGTPETQKFQRYLMGEKSGDLKSNRVSVLLEDQAKRLWVGTYGGLHLYQVQSDDFLNFSKRQGDTSALSSDIIISLHEDKKGKLWIGTPNGLNLAIPDGKGSWVFKCFQEKDGLPDNYIHAILEDDSGHLWISTNKGISKFNTADLTFYNYDVVDGLQSNSFMEGAAFKDSDGMFYFGGIYGLNTFHPDSIKNSSYTPQVVLTGLKIFNKNVHAGELFDDKAILSQSIEYCKHIRLSHKMNVFSIDYAALNFHAASKNLYRYKMEGLENEWNNAGPQKSVTYNNLSPGKYTFKVQTLNHKETSEQSGASLEIEVLPPFWATKTAIFLYVLVFAGLLLLYQYIIGKQNKLKNKLELARLARKKEVEIAEMKTRFFTNITHELRTPLTLISGPVEEMMESGKLNGKLKDYLITIHQHTQRLSKLVNQLLDFRKAESGHMKMEAAKGNIVKFSHEIFLSFQELADRDRIDFRFEPDQEEIPLFYDRDKMEIVLCNLLSNAFKYSPTGGRINLSIRQIPESSFFSQGHCEISISDNGPGMPEELIAKIFDRFFQIANTDSVKMVGTGIGLSLVKNIVELHEGQIKVSSEVNEGSTFSIFLPLGRAHLSDKQLISEFKDSEHPSHYQPANNFTSSTPENHPLVYPANESERVKLLVVDDNLEIRTFIRKTLELDYQIIEAENGIQAIEASNEKLPELIISDVMMPEMDGLSLCRHLKENEKTAHIPVILLTARTSTVFKVEGFNSGADAYVTKPFNPKVLKAQVSSILQARKKLKEYFSKIVTLEPTNIEITSFDEKFLNEIIALVENNLTNDLLSRDFLAQSMAMSPSTFYRKIKTLTGHTTNAFIRSIRLKRAGQMMHDSGLNISEIAYQVGYNDLKYFRTCFREQFGMNPSEYVDQVNRSVEPLTS